MNEEKTIKELTPEEIEKQLQMIDLLFLGREEIIEKAQPVS